MKAIISVFSFLVFTNFSYAGVFCSIDGGVETGAQVELDNNGNIHMSFAEMNFTLSSKDLQSGDVTGRTYNQYSQILRPMNVDALSSGDIEIFWLTEYSFLYNKSTGQGFLNLKIGDAAPKFFKFENCK